MFFYIGLLCYSFLIALAASDSQIQTVIVHMPGNADYGFDFLNYDIKGTLSYSERFSKELNPEKVFFKCEYLKQCLVYTNNLPIKEMDLGGPRCVQFYKEMIIEVYKRYPEVKIILAGSSQGSVGPFGALAQLAQKNHPVISNIEKVAIEAPLGSIHETINFHARKNSVLKILSDISEKIAPLLAEYLPQIIPGFACYDAFAPQLYHYIKAARHLRHIQYYIIHDKADDIIPYHCAQETHRLLGNCLLKTTNLGLHLPAEFRRKKILDFLGDKNTVIQKAQPDSSQYPHIDNWFNSKDLKRFAIRRIRDTITVVCLYYVFDFLLF